MHTIKNVMLTTIAGLVLIGAGVAHSAKNAQTEAVISARQAADIALAAIPGRVYELELEREDGVMTWEVELVSAQDNKAYEVMINATSGEVIEKELENDEWSFFGFRDKE